MPLCFCSKHYRLEPCAVCKLCPSIKDFGDEDPAVQCAREPGHTGLHSGGSRCGTLTWENEHDHKD